MKKVLFLFVNLFFCCTLVHAEEIQKSELIYRKLYQFKIN